MRRRLKQAAKKVDNHPVVAAFALTGTMFGALLIWASLASDPVLLGRAGVEHRTNLYGQVSSTAVALLAVALTVLSILIALPDRPRVEELRQRSGWRLLQAMLMAAALLCLLTLVAAHVGAAVDRKAPIEWLEQLTVASAVSALITVAISGVAFAMLLRAASQPPDPSLGRGEGPATTTVIPKPDKVG